MTSFFGQVSKYQLNNMVNLEIKPSLSKANKKLLILTKYIPPPNTNGEVLKKIEALNIIATVCK